MELNKRHQRVSQSPRVSITHEMYSGGALSRIWWIVLYAKVMTTREIFCKWNYQVSIPPTASTQPTISTQTCFERTRTFQSGKVELTALKSVVSNWRGKAGGKPVFFFLVLSIWTRTHIVIMATSRESTPVPTNKARRALSRLKSTLNTPQLIPNRQATPRRTPAGTVQITALWLWCSSKSHSIALLQAVYPHLCGQSSSLRLQLQSALHQLKDEGGVGGGKSCRSSDYYLQVFK